MPSKSCALVSSEIRRESPFERFFYIFFAPILLRLESKNPKDIPRCKESSWLSCLRHSLTLQAFARKPALLRPVMSCRSGPAGAPEAAAAHQATGQGGRDSPKP